MSGDERAQQIGMAVSAYQDAKVELAHLEQKLRTVGETYREVSRAILTPSSGSGDYTVEKGRFKLLYSPYLKGEHANFITGHDALVALIEERDAAKDRVLDPRRQLREFRITSVE